MREIEKKMVAAVVNQTELRGGNTTVEWDGPDGIVRLFGNPICFLNRFDGTFKMSSSGWRTPTTRSRLNALASVLNDAVGARIRDFDLEISTDGGDTYESMTWSQTDAINTDAWA